jgi:hypothetical protein
LLDHLIMWVLWLLGKCFLLHQLNNTFCCLLQLLVHSFSFFIYFLGYHVSFLYFIS